MPQVLNARKNALWSKAWPRGDVVCLETHVTSRLLIEGFLNVVSEGGASTTMRGR